MERESLEGLPHTNKSSNLPIPSLLKRHKFTPCKDTLKLDDKGISNEELSEMFHFLQHTLNSLSCIDIMNVKISDEAIKCVASSLNHLNFNIQRLNFFNNNLSTEGVKCFFNELKWNTCLQSLNIDDICIDDEGAEHVADYLGSNATLTRLILFDCKMNGEGVMCLGESLLNRNTTLRSLDLGGNFFGEDENVKVLRIGECFGAITHLTELSFDECGLEGEYFREFLDGLLKNTYLHSLDLSCSDMRDDGAKQIVEYIGRNSNLTKLSLNECKIGKEGGICLGECLTHNTSLLSLDFFHNLIGDEGGKAMAQMIRYNNSLRSLNLDYCNI